MTARKTNSTPRKDFQISQQDTDEAKGDRIAKVIARAGICSRREVEQWIAEGRVQLNGQVLDTPAVVVGKKDEIQVDGRKLPDREPTRLWIYHKPKGFITTNKDPNGRPTVFSKLPDSLPRVVSVGRLDLNTEGLLLLTNDGGLARILELPSTGWLRRYKVRAYGRISQQKLDTLIDGTEIDGTYYGAIEAKLVSEKKDNCWMEIGLREGKNREVKRVLEQFGMKVGRLIRTSFGPFQLGDLPKGEVREVARKVLRDQLGSRLAKAAGLDFETRVTSRKPQSRKPEQNRFRKGPPGRKSNRKSTRSRRT